jgi:cytochrome oxidase Cu insertion factor (SCO1/SenC/PrrC family)
MTLSMRTTAVVVLLVGLWLAPSSLAADLDMLLKDFRATPTGLKPAPAFSVKALDGKTITLADHRGRPVLLYFWATW